MFDNTFESVSSQGIAERTLVDRWFVQFLFFFMVYVAISHFVVPIQHICMGVVIGLTDPSQNEVIQQKRPDLLTAFTSVFASCYGMS